MNKLKNINNNTSKEKDNTIKRNDNENISLFKLFWIFYIGCLAGVIVETIWCILTNGYFEYRTALILEPLNPVYGCGAVVITLLLYKLQSKSNIVLYFSSFVIGGLFEAACSVFQELVFGTVSWVYKPSNFGILNNRTSLLYCFLWGFLGIFWVRILYPFLSKVIKKIHTKLGKILTGILVCFVIIDMIFSSSVVLRQRARRNNIPAKNKIEVFYDNVFNDEVLKFFYHNITVKK